MLDLSSCGFQLFRFSRTRPYGHVECILGRSALSCVKRPYACYIVHTVSNALRHTLRIYQWCQTPLHTGPRVPRSRGSLRARLLQPAPPAALGHDGRRESRARGRRCPGAAIATLDRSWTNSGTYGGICNDRIVPSKRKKHTDRHVVDTITRASGTT